MNNVQTLIKTIETAKLLIETTFQRPALIEEIAIETKLPIEQIKLLSQYRIKPQESNTFRKYKKELKEKNLTAMQLHRILKPISSTESIEEIDQQGLTPEAYQIPDDSYEEMIRTTENSILHEQIETIMEKHLKPKQRNIIKHKHGWSNTREHTLEETGREFGVTRERIRQILMKIEDIIKNKLIESYETEELKQREEAQCKRFQTEQEYYAQKYYREAKEQHMAKQQIIKAPITKPKPWDWMIRGNNNI